MNALEEADAWAVATKKWAMLALVLVVCIGSALFIQHLLKPATESVSKPLPVAKEVAQEVMIALPEKTPIKAYRPSVKKKLNLPVDVQADPGAHVIATGKLSATEDRPYTLTTVIDEKTGESTVFARPDDLPWLSVAQRSQISIQYGLRSGEPVGRLSVSHSFLNIKSASLGVAATLDHDGQWFAGAGVSYRW